MSHPVLARLFQIFGTTLTIGVLAVSALTTAPPAAAQDMDCEYDPPVLSITHEGRLIALHVWYKTSLRISQNQAVQYSAMTAHFTANSTQWIESIARNG